MFIQTILVPPYQESEEGDFQGEESEGKPFEDNGEDKPSQEVSEVEFAQEQADAETDEEEKPDGKKGSDDQDFEGENSVEDCTSCYKDEFIKELLSDPVFDFVPLEERLDRGVDEV